MDVNKVYAVCNITFSHQNQTLQAIVSVLVMALSIMEETQDIEFMRQTIEAS
jgi:hypothetical protein